MDEATTYDVRIYRNEVYRARRSLHIGSAGKQATGCGEKAFVP
jgi:hypothetical protein